MFENLDVWNLKRAEQAGPHLAATYLRMSQSQGFRPVRAAIFVALAGNIAFFRGFNARPAKTPPG
jgi:hypothetical protein